jgi:C-terminal processing protease CtpA/Prc
MRLKFTFLVLCLTLLTLVGAAFAQEGFPPAEIVNDEGGPVVVRGEMPYTSSFFLAGLAEPLIMLENHAGFVNRDSGFVFPPESQVLGQFTSSIYESPVSFTISLPIEPQGTLTDVDNNGEEDTGVMIFGVAFWTNNFGDPYLEPRDFGVGWSTDYASFLVDPGTREVLGGKYLVFAPVAGQGFPSGFGEDGLLFTEDDPIVEIPQGYTVVNLDTDPFTFDRSREAQIDTIESPLSASEDYTGLSYTEAFDALVSDMQTTYAFTEYKNVDWDALIEEFRPRFEEADASGDPTAYAFALRDFTWSIPDGHIGMSSVPPLDEDFTTQTSGGLGMSLAELTDGPVIVSFVLPGGPADEAGIQIGAEITEINGEAIDNAISASVPYSSPFSNDVNRRLQQLRYVIRFPLDTDVEVTYQNPGADEPDTAELTTVDERQSFSYSSFYRGVTGTEPPVQYEFLDSGYGYVKINSFFENAVLTVQTLEYFINLANQYGVPGIIIDLRQNGGGSGLLADSMAGYFFPEEFVNGYTAYYSDEAGEFVAQEDAPTYTYPAPENFQYGGEVVLLTGPACASACEFFSYNMTHDDRAVVIGHYPTAGLGGSVTAAYMPEGVTLQYTIGQGMDENRQIHIEGTGIVPNVLVPVTEESVFYNGDYLLDSAVTYLNELFGVTGDTGSSDLVFTDGGEIAVGDIVTGEISAGERVQYLLNVSEDATLTISLGDEEGALDSYLRVYDADGNLLDENDDIELGVNINSLIENVEVAAGDVLIIEVGTYDDAASGEYTLSVTAE